MTNSSLKVDLFKEIEKKKMGDVYNLPLSAELSKYL